MTVRPWPDLCVRCGREGPIRDGHVTPSRSPGARWGIDGDVCGDCANALRRNPNARSFRADGVRLQELAAAVLDFCETLDAAGLQRMRDLAEKVGK